MVECPICGQSVRQTNINSHIDSDCKDFVEQPDSSPQDAARGPVQNFFRPPGKKVIVSSSPASDDRATLSAASKNGPVPNGLGPTTPTAATTTTTLPVNFEDDPEPPAKKLKPSRSTPPALQRAAPLADRVRPRTLDEVCGVELVGPGGVLRGLIEDNKLPSIILWGGPGSGKTTIARAIAQAMGSRFVEINSTSSGVGECKKIFDTAKHELSLTGRKTILFCDEIHRFSKAQQDIFLAPVESGLVTLIGATTENPSFKVISALLSRCQTFALQKLSNADVITILRRALDREGPAYDASPALVNDELLAYLASFADGDARMGLNLLELAMDLSRRPEMTIDRLKQSLTRTFVYDRSGDQHYDTISAFHKSLRGSDPDAALYYLARMLASGEDPLFIARRLVVVASEDVGLADNSMLSLATAAFAAVERIGLPEGRIPLAHATVALALAPKSTRAYRGLANAQAALAEPGVAGLPIPIHLRNAPTRLMKELGYGEEYKYNPNYKDGKVVQDYLPEKIKGMKFLEDADLGDELDPDYDYVHGNP